MQLASRGVVSDPLVDLLEVVVPAMQGRAEILDATEAFPEEDISTLRRLGILVAPLPPRLGGRGAGTEQSGATLLLSLLRLLGRGNLSTGRLFEAHVNAIQLICKFGSKRQTELLAERVRNGALFGLWVTDLAGAELTASDSLLRGCKSPCSGVGFVTDAVVTVGDKGDRRMAWAPLGVGEQAILQRSVMQGMRSTAQGCVCFDGVPVASDAFCGDSGDYLREPEFSTGAWRTSAVTLGGLDSLLDAARQQLLERRRQDSPLQQERFGRACIAVETARLWVSDAAMVAESAGVTATKVAYVNLARIAVETASLDALRLIQRSLGLTAFVRPNPVERIARDLATYLRQPAPDAVLTEAATYYLASSGREL